MSQQSTREQQLDNLKGQRLGPYLSHNPVSATQIWQWCKAMGDTNPGYRPGDQQFAPPAMMQMWTMRDFNDQYAPGSTDAPPYRVFDEMRVMGYPANVAVSYDLSFHRYLKVGERAQHYTSVVQISDRKTTRLGTGYFVTERVEYLTQDETEFAEALITYFQYQPTAAASGASTATTAAVDPRIQPSKSRSAPADWQPHYRDIDVSQMLVGDRLPALEIPITHKLIVGGAIATQDYIPVHHNVPAAQAAGMPDIFMNILTTCGLSARYLSDWAGPNSRLRKLKFDLMAPNLPGDIMLMGGEIQRVDNIPSGAEVGIAFNGSNRLGYHMSGTATLAVPGATKSA